MTKRFEKIKIVEAELTDSLGLGSQTCSSRRWKEEEGQAKKGEKRLPLKRKQNQTVLSQVPEDLQKLKKTLSDKTKRKIAENNRKFSICKLCR